MNARIRKECRALAPMWAVALLLVVAPLFLPLFARGYTATIEWLAPLFRLLFLPLYMLGIMTTIDWLAPFYVLGVVLLSVAAFGREFAQGTYGLLLVQPVSRWRLWWEKTLVLAAALITVWLALALVATVPASLHERYEFGISHSLGYCLLLAAVAYGGGLLSTLLLRQASGAFWLTLLLPAALSYAALWLGGGLFGPWRAGWILVATLVVYSVVAYAVALRLFLKREDLPWVARDVTIPLSAWPAGRSTPPRPGRRFGALAALIAKELHFQQVNLFGGLLLVLLFAGVVATRHSDTAVGAVDAYGILFGILVHKILFGLGILVYILIPFLVGAVAIAEERRLGVLEWQQSLPVSRWRQFLAKLLPAHATSLFLGVSLPWLLDALAYAATGQSVTGSMNAFRTASDPNRTAEALWVTLGLPGLFCLVATTVGIFASSLIRNPLQALSLMIGFVAATWIVGGLFLLNYQNASVSPLGLLALVAMPTLLVVLCWLSYRNYCEAIPGARLWRRNLTVLAVTYVGILATTAAVYARAWEVFIPGPRISESHVKGTVTSKILAQHPVHFILLPNGSLWEWKRDRTYSNPPQPLGKAGEWRDVASRWILRKPYILEALALKPDGTLWHWQYVSSTNVGLRRETAPLPLGTDRDWIAIAGNGSHVVALKTDRSLWAWGENAYGQLGDGTTVDREEPVRIGTDSDWMQATTGYWTTLALKADGSLWEWGAVATPGTHLRSGKVDYPTCPTPRRVNPGTNWALAAVSSFGSSFAIRTDGSLWRWGLYDWERPEPLPGGGGERPIPMIHFTQGPTRVGTDRDCVEFRWDGNRGVGLKSDGTLFSYPVNRSPRADLEQMSFSRLRDLKPWLAADFLWPDFGVALAADGSLWTWGVPPRYTNDEVPQREWRLLPPSVPPRLVARLAGGNAE